MASKTQSVSSKKNKEAGEQKTATPQKRQMRTIIVEDNCLGCKWFASGPDVFQGPHCENQSSPKFRKRMPESGWCDKFEAKAPGARPGRAKATGPRSDKSTAAVDAANGLYGEGERTLDRDGDAIQHDIFDESENG